MKNVDLVFKEERELPVIAKQILEATGTHKVFAITGQMGAGKTTLIKEICRQLGSAGNFSSPTYSIVNEYAVSTSPATRHPSPIYHIDLYRLNTLKEALDIGIEDYISGNNYCFIEWPELIETLLPADVIRIDIEMHDNSREIAIFIR